MTREINIKPVLNGFICKVGCQTVVFGDVATLASNIERYYKNPEAVEKEFIAKAVNKMMDGPPCDTGLGVGLASNSDCVGESPSPVRELRR